MKRSEVVSRHEDLRGGELVFAGTRVPVQTLTDYLKGGHTLDRFLHGFPTVERAQAEAYLDMVQQRTAEEEAPPEKDPAEEAHARATG
jgi:uncharacterized protein (DUF433 family)